MAISGWICGQLLAGILTLPLTSSSLRHQASLITYVFLSAFICNIRFLQVLCWEFSEIIWTPCSRGRICMGTFRRRGDCPSGFFKVLYLHNLFAYILPFFPFNIRNFYHSYIYRKNRYLLSQLEWRCFSNQSLPSGSPTGELSQRVSYEIAFVYQNSHGRRDG